MGAPGCEVKDKDKHIEAQQNSQQTWIVLRDRFQKDGATGNWAQDILTALSASTCATPWPKEASEAQLFVLTAVKRHLELHRACMPADSAKFRVPPLLDLVRRAADKDALPAPCADPVCAVWRKRRAEVKKGRSRQPH
jgi:hypothetical protein